MSDKTYLNMKECDIKIRSDLKVEARIYRRRIERNIDNANSKVGGDDDNGLKQLTHERADKTLVCWAHGLDHGMANEDLEKIWNFWDVPIDTDGDHNSDMSSSGEVVIARYSARGHGNTSQASQSSQTTWKQLGEDLLQLTNTLIDHLSAPILTETNLLSEHPGKGSNSGSYDSSNNDRISVVLGGSSMGAASTLFAAVAAVYEQKLSKRATLKGVMLVTPPTCYESRDIIAGKLMKAASFSKQYNSKSTRLPRTLFEGHIPKECEHSIRSDSYEYVMMGSALSNFPPKDVLVETLKNLKILVLAWDSISDSNHPACTASLLKDLAPHAEVHIATKFDDLVTWPIIMNQFILESELLENAIHSNL